MTLRTAFMGSPEFALPTLKRMLADGHDIACVYSQLPRPAGRGKALRPTPVHAFADAHGLPVRTPEKLKGEAEKQAFADLDLDVAIVVAYGLILPRAVLNAPRHGCINLHGSLLPRWRGAAPIHRAVMEGDRETGVQTMVMEAGLDTGDILLTARTPITGEDTTGSVHDRLAELGAALVSETLLALERGTLTATPQSDTDASYAEKISSAEARIDWSRTAGEIDCHIRGLSLVPGAWCEMRGPNGSERLKVLFSKDMTGLGHEPAEPGTVLDDALSVATGSGAVRLLTVQRPGKTPVPADVFLAGRSSLKGSRLT